MPLILVLAAAAAAPQQAVIGYPPAFFAGSGATNAYEMILRVPGFTFVEGDAVRGFEGAAGNVLIDGQRPASKTDSLTEALRRVPAGQVARIELIRGGAPGIDMQGKAVIANVVRAAGGGVQGVAAIASSYIPGDGRIAPSLRLEGSGGSGGRSWELSFREGLGVDDGSGPGPGVRVDAHGRILARSRIKGKGDTWQTTGVAAFETPLAGGRLRLNGRLFSDRYAYDEVNAFSLPAGALSTTVDRNPKFDTEAGARYSRPFGVRTALEAIALRQTHHETFREAFAEIPGDRDDFSLARDSSESIARAVLKFRPSERLSFEGGGEAALNKLASGTAFRQDGVASALPAANVRVRETRGEGFAKLVWRPAAHWTVEGDLRQESSTISSSGDLRLEKSLAFTKPRLAMAWAPDADTQVRARFERTVGQLSFDDFVASASLNTGQVSAGNPDLNPEQAWVGEAAVERRFPGGVAAVVALRHFALTDVVDRAPVFVGADVFDRPDNIGKGTKDELQLTLTLPFDRLGWRGAQLRGDATWRKSQVRDPTTGRHRSISALRPLEWEAHFTHDLPQWRLNWGVDVVGGWRETYYRADNVEIRKLKTWVAPFVERKLTPSLSLRFEADNITARGFRNTRYAYSGARSAGQLAYVNDRDIQFGRIFYVRLRRTFGA